MIVLLICLVVLVALGLYLADYSHDFVAFMGEVIAFCGCLGLVAYAFLCFGYISAGYKAKIINKEYVTSYTQEEVFYASDVIDTIQELHRKRIELKVTGEK